MPDSAAKRLTVFTRFPQPGQSKTRLIPALGPDGAAALQRRMTMHCLTICRKSLRQSADFCLEVRYTACSRGEIRHWLGSDLLYTSQGNGCLGTRLQRTIQDAFRNHAGKAIILGADCPGINPEIIHQAFERLNHSQLVLGPAADGGYYLIGFRKDGLPEQWPTLFHDIDWGTENVLSQTLAKAAADQLRVALLPQLYDVDRPADIEVWDKIEHESVNSEATRLSVIIPAKNEEQNIGRTVADALHAQGAEVLVADGGSRDRTQALAREAGAEVISSPPGRARQMNAGAAGTTGANLLFLHADSILPGGYDAYIRYLLNLPGVSAGAFTFALDKAGLGYRILCGMVNFRSRVLQMPYGDQGLFLTRDLFTQISGYPQLPILEDYEMIRRLKRTGRIAIASAPLVTAARRWDRLGLFRTTLRNWSIIAGYHARIAPEKLAAWYRC